MRLTKDQSKFIKETIKGLLPEADIFLFGSRTQDHLKGGDIDILVIGDSKLTDQQKRSVKIAFYKNFGQQKIDIVSFTRDASSTFKELALIDAIRL